MSFFSSKRSRIAHARPLRAGFQVRPATARGVRDPATGAGARRMGRGGARVARPDGTLLGSGLTSDSSLTNHPESATAQDLIDARLPGQSAVDEVIVVRSERFVVSDPAFAARMCVPGRAGPSRAAP